jgi:hypothetical protein
MKLKNNSRFGGIAVVVFTDTNFYKFQGFIEFLGSLIGLPDFQENSFGAARQKVENEALGVAFSAVRGGGREIQNLPFAGVNGPRHEESDHLTFCLGYAEVVAEVLGGVPLSGFWALPLNF